MQERVNRLCATRTQRVKNGKFKTFLQKQNYLFLEFYFLKLNLFNNELSVLDFFIIANT